MKKKMMVMVANAHGATTIIYGALLAICGIGLGLEAVVAQQVTRMPLMFKTQRTDVLVRGVSRDIL